LRKLQEKPKSGKKQTAITGHAVYERDSAALPLRVKLVATHLDTLNSLFRRLFSDEHFVTLLRAESLSSIPSYLKLLLQREKRTFQ
jgi:hypothetical protein